MNSTETRSKRTVHDVWAIILYAITAITTNTIASAYTPTVTNFKGVESIVKISIVYCLFYTAFFVAGLYYAPVLLIHLGFIFSMVLPPLLSLLSGNIFLICLSLVSSIVIGYLYFKNAYKYIPMSGQILKDAMGIVIRHFLYVFGLLSVLTILICIQLYFLFNILSNVKGLINILTAFYLFWSFSIAMYFGLVFVSNLVSMFLFNEGRKSINFALESLKNTLLSIGTICFGALLIAVIQALRYIVYTKEVNRRVEDRSALTAILIFIAKLLLSIMEDILEMINSWVFVYVAVYGKSYLKSIRGSYEKITQPENMMFLNNLITDEGIFFMTFVGSIGFFGVLYLFNITYFYKSVVFVPVFAVFYFISLIGSIFSGALKTVLFVYAEKPDCIRKVIPKTDEMIGKVKEGLF